MNMICNAIPPMPRLCVANINNSRLNKICRLETGKETPDRVASEQYNYYNY